MKTDGFHSQKGNKRKCSQTLKPLAPLSGCSSVIAVVSVPLSLFFKHQVLSSSVRVRVCVCELECMRSPCVVCYGAEGSVNVCPADLTSAVTILDLTLYHILSSFDTRYNF